MIKKIIKYFFIKSNLFKKHIEQYNKKINKCLNIRGKKLFSKQIVIEKIRKKQENPVTFEHKENTSHDKYIP